MKTERPLYWHQGLFLQPQHFQLLDHIHSSRLGPLLEYGKPYFWGIAGLKIQQAALQNKLFEILEGEVLFPDGSHLVFPGNTAVKPRSFEGAWVQGEKPFTVFLGVRKWNPTAQNVTTVADPLEMSGVNTRFATATDPEEVVDLHGTGPAAQLKRLHFVARLFWETEQQHADEYLLLPIAQLERSGEEIRLSDRFIPPCLTVAASSWLLKIIKEIRDQVASRRSQLSEYRSPKKMRSMQFEMGSVILLMALHSLNRYVPQLDQIGETKIVHPWDVYGILRQLVGELSIFSEGTPTAADGQAVEVELPAYDHLAIGPCFQAAARAVGQLLDKVLIGPEFVIRLEFDGKYYLGNLPREAFDRKNSFWLVLQTEADSELMKGSVSQVAKLAAMANLNTLIARAIPGLPLQHHPVTPSGLPQRVNSYYFKIEPQNPLWAAVMEAGAIAMFWNTAPKDVKADLIVLRGS